MVVSFRRTVNTDGVICSMEHCNELLGARSLMKAIAKPMLRHAFWHLTYKTSKSPAETIIAKPMLRHAFWHLTYKTSKSPAETIIS